MKWVYRGLIAIAFLVVGAIALAYWVALRAENPVGLQVSRATDPDGKPIAVGVWYRSESRGHPTAQLGTVLMEVAQGAAVKGRALPLVVISHGNVGGLQSDADLALALASAGYVVAAPMHAGDNFMDLSASGSAALYNGRNRQFLAVIEHMVSQWPGHGLIDAEKVGVFGFSAGGLRQKGFPHDHERGGGEVLRQKLEALTCRKPVCEICPTPGLQIVIDLPAFSACAALR